MKKILLGFSIASLIILAGCAKKPAPGSSSYGEEGAVGTQTYGYPGQTTFQTDASGRRINPLTAPANNSYYFSYDSNSVDARDNHAMDIQANYIATHPTAKVRLEGNTDNRGSREYNIGLGWRRDQAVAAYFEQQGVKANQIQMISNGKEKPVAMGDNEHAWSLNRRVDLIYISN